VWSGLYSRVQSGYSSSAQYSPSTLQYGGRTHEEVGLGYSEEFGGNSYGMAGMCNE